MGNTQSNSTELLQVPFERSVAPFRMSKLGTLTEALMRFRLKPPGFTCDNTQAFDADTQQPRFELVRSLLSYRVDIRTPDGDVVLSIKEKPFEGYYRVYEGTERETHSFKVTVRGEVTSAVICCEFRDRISGDLVRVFTEGDCGDSVAIFYVERHAAELPPMLKRGNMKRTTCKVMGRIRRPELCDDEYLIGTGGVDMTVLLVLWVVRHDRQERQGSMGSVPPISKSRIGAVMFVDDGGE